MIEVNGPGGIYGEMGRCLFLGDVPAELADANALLEETRDRTIKLLKPGADPKEIWDANNAFLVSKGQMPESRVFCHGQGYSLVERPAVRNDETMKLKANMNITVHPTVFFEHLLALHVGQLAHHRDRGERASPQNSRGDSLRLEATGASMRKIMLRGHEFMKKHIPTFENSFILDTASQTGTRGARRLVGEYTITEEDIRLGTIHDDAVAIIPRFIPREGWSPYLYFPYRALVPAKVDGLLVAGRSFSSDGPANNMVNLIPHCIATGQAAGTAAMLALKHGVEVRKVSYKELQDALRLQGVPLP